MTWFRVDDGFWSHPKVVGLSDGAIATWVRAGTYSSQHLTDGFVTAGALRLVGDKDSAAELVEASLWDIAPGGWQFHDWGEYQETSATVKERRAAARERQRKSRAARETKRTAAQPNSGESEPVVTPDVTRDNTREFSTPDPSRPDHISTNRPPVFDVPTDRAPARIEGGGEGVSLRQPRGTREVAERWNETAHSGPAHMIVRQYEKHIGAPVPGEVMSGMAQRIDECLASGISPEQIARGLNEWHTSKSWATSQIPTFVHKAGATPKQRGHSKPSQAANDAVSIAEEMIAKGLTRD